MELNLLVEDLGLLKRIPVGARPQFPPEPSLVLALLQRLLQRLQVAMQAGVLCLEPGFGLLAQIRPRPSPVVAGGQDNHPEVGPVRTPAAKVGASHVGLDEFLASFVLSDELALAVVINQERLVKAGLDSI